MRTLAPALFLLASCISTSNDVYPACGYADEDQQCLDRFDVKGGNLPIYRNINISVPELNYSVYQAVIVVQAGSRDANKYFHTMMDAAKQAIDDEITAVISPHFECAADDPPPGDLVWACDGADDWSHGGPTATGAPMPVYSYEAMDRLIATLADKQTFPNLTRIVVTGMGAGGQLVDRYAATTGIDPLAGVTITYAPVAPSSYMWLDPARPAGADGSADCGGYDAYPYGLDDRNGYVATPSAATVVDRARSRAVTYFVGDGDTLANSAGTGARHVVRCQCARHRPDLSRAELRQLDHDGPSGDAAGRRRSGLRPLALVHVLVPRAEHDDLPADALLS